MRPSSVLENWSGSGDPANTNDQAHETAVALLNLISKGAKTPENNREISESDIDELAELWQLSPEDSLPGTLWGLYVLRATLIDHPEITSKVVILGSSTIGELDDPIDNNLLADVTDFLNLLFTGRFNGNFGEELQQAAKLALIGAEGLRKLDNSQLPIGEDNPEDRAMRFEKLAFDLYRSATFWQRGELD